MLYTLRSSLRSLQPHIAMQTRFREILEELMRMEDAKDFCRPVSNKVCPDYRTRIKRPIDLGTIMKRNMELRYSNADRFLADIRLIWENAAEYNGMNSSLTQSAERVHAAAENTIEAEREEFERLEQRRIRDAEERGMGRLTEAQLKAREQEDKEDAARKAERESKAAIARVTNQAGGVVVDGQAQDTSVLFNLLDATEVDSSDSDSDDDSKDGGERATPPPTTTTTTASTT